MSINETPSTPNAANPFTYRLLGLPVLLREATAGGDLTPLGAQLLEYVRTHDDPDALLDLSLVLQLKYQKSAALAVQAQAIQLRRQYRLKQASVDPAPLRVLALKAPGDLMANTPFECLLEHADLQIEAFYIDDQPLRPADLPPHDVIFVAACASDQNAGVLVRIATLIADLGPDVRVLNRPGCIGRTTRDAAYALLGAERGLCMAHTLRLRREQVLEAVAGRLDLPAALGRDFPFIIRPVGSHAGQGLVKASDSASLAQYLNESDAAEYYVAPFIDYSDADGLFRKYRIVIIDGKPFVCHMGISSEWMVHYPYAEMIAHPERRQEEADLMATFDTDFAVRHRGALQRIADLTGLDYVGFDCAETSDGRLLIFEIATGMVVHDMDDSATFPYKLPQIQRVFAAFEAMLRRAAGRPA